MLANFVKNPTIGSISYTNISPRDIQKRKQVNWFLKFRIQSFLTQKIQIVKMRK